MNDSKKFLGKLKNLTIHALMDYWCRDDTEACKLAKIGEIIRACEKGEIVYEGKGIDWGYGSDRIRFGLIQGNLLINRESFDEWLAHFLEKDDNATRSPINFKAEQTFLKIIGALVTIHYSKPPFQSEKTGKYNATAIEEEIMQHFLQDDNLKPGTIRRKIPAALDAIKENLYAGDKKN